MHGSRISFRQEAAHFASRAFSEKMGLSRAAADLGATNIGLGRAFSVPSPSSMGRRVIRGSKTGTSSLLQQLYNSAGLSIAGYFDLIDNEQNRNRDYGYNYGPGPSASQWFADWLGNLQQGGRLL